MYDMIDRRRLKKVASSPSPVTGCCDTCVEARDDTRCHWQENSLGMGMQGGLARHGSASE